MPEQTSAEKHKLLGLDHLRAFAISYVILFHYQFFWHPAWVNRVASFGWSGVDLFFVLSGFLISGQLFNIIAKGKKISLREFFIKRFFRIIPPFLVVVILYVAIPAFREWGHLSPIWRYLTFTLNFGLDISKYGTFSHAWSLCVEEQFYLILPLIFLLFNYFKKGRKISTYLLITLFLGGFAVRLWGWNYFIKPVISTDHYGLYWNRYIYYPTYNRLDSLLVGVSIAGLYVFYPAFKIFINRYCNVILISGVCLLIAAGFLCKGYATYNTTIWGFPLIALSYGLIVAAVVSPANFVFRLKSFVTTQIASLSYAMYLTHKMVIHATQNILQHVGIDRRSNLSMLICLVCVIAGALLSRYLIERPSMRLRNRILKQVKTG